MALLTVDGIPLPEPTSYKVTQSDLDSENTYRSEAGYMQRDRVRAGIYQIEVGWTVRRDEYRTIVQALSPAKFTVTFFDPHAAQARTTAMYAGDRSGTLIAYADDERPDDSLWDLTCSLIEF